jgi:ABC-type dipeptide/oligopeptide/nickel transport system permease component
VLARYAFRRLLWVIPVIIGASILAFVIMHAAPGSPWSREGRQLPPALVARLTEELRLDEPLPVQYVIWLQNMLGGNMGLTTTTHPDPVAHCVRRWRTSLSWD